MDNKKEQFKIGALTAAAIVVANMIGTGVFTSLGFQVFDIHSGFALLSIWIVGGFLSLAGAFSYGELSAAMPRSGGEYHLLSKIYNPLVGFLSGWISFTVGFAAPIAAAAIAMAKYLSKVLIDTNILQESGRDSFMLTLAVCVVIVVSIIHTFNLKAVGKFQEIATLFKVALVVGFIICGLIMAKPTEISFAPTSQSFNEIFSMPFAISLIFTMYAYSGWNAATYVASEIRNPGKNIPIALFAGTLAVMVMYILINFVFLYSTPIDTLKGEVEVGSIAANAIFGNVGSVIMGSLISLGLVSAISSMTWAGPRVSMVMGEDMKLFSFLSRKNKNGIPTTALLVQLAIVIVLILTSSFENIIIYTGLITALSTFLTVLGVFVLRIKQPNLERPYKTWGYPIMPILFLAITAYMIYWGAVEKPVQSLLGFATLAVGSIFYYLNAKYEKRNNVEI